MTHAHTQEPSVGSPQGPAWPSPRAGIEARLGLRPQLQASQLPASDLRRRNRRARAEGFTLVELLVALTAGLLVASAAYLLARNSMRSFQEESRMATGQVGAALAMARITADLQRAGYMSSPNVALDPRICEGVTRSDIPLEAIQVLDEGSGAAGGLDNGDMGYGAENVNLTMPDVVVISGNMTSAEQFEYRVVDGSTVHMAIDRGPIQRAFEDVGRDADALAAIFVPIGDDGGTVGERFARIVEPSGKESYVVVTNAVAVTSGAYPNFVLESMTLTIAEPSVARNAPFNSGPNCGFVNRGSGLINPVSIIRYRVAQLCDPYACSAADTPFFAALQATGDDRVTGESTRAELVREELLPTEVGDVFDLTLTYADDLSGGLASQEVVTEFAVEFDFAMFHVPDVGGGPPLDTPALALVTDGGVDGIPGQRVRSLSFQLGTRARVPDRDAGNPSLAVTRFELAPLSAANARYRWARMRTLHGEVQFPNLQAVQW